MPQASLFFKSIKKEDTDIQKQMKNNNKKSLMTQH